MASVIGATLSPPDGSDRVEACADLLLELPVLDQLRREVSESRQPLLVTNWKIIKAVAAEQYLQFGLLADRIDSDDETAQRRGLRLVRQGLLDLDESGMLTVTPAGYRQLREMESEMADAMSDRMPGLSTPDIEKLTDLLRRVGSGIAD